MYVSQQMLRVHHDEWLRRAEARRLVGQVRDERRLESRPLARRPPRLRRLRLGRPVSHA
jgi:hypothetical protein